jgi:hypothetical protein
MAHATPKGLPILFSYTVQQGQGKGCRFAGASLSTGE